jgi:hypothetical protein
MNKKTQQILGVLAIVGLGYWAYTKYGKKKSFANLTSKTGKRTTSSTENPTQNICGDTCNGGVCYVAVYDANGNVTYQKHSCSGTIGSQIGGVLGI